MTRGKKILVGLAPFVISAAIWIPCLHFFFAKPASEFHARESLSPMARELAARHLYVWTDPKLREQELKRMRASNAEWDFMGRSFLVWSLANMGLRAPASRQICLETMDRIIEETLRLEQEFAHDQYRRARRELGEITLGFGYAHEWPASWHGPADIDSGPIVPVFNISAGSSGMAFVGASAFRDEKFLASLVATLDFAAFPSRNGGRLKYCASNQVGDAALLYATTLGPVWEKLKAGRKL